MFSSKEGDVFSPFIILFSILLLGLLAFTIIQNEKNRDSKVNIVGQQSASLLKIYDEAEKAQFYIKEAVMQADKDAQNILVQNGGYPAKNKCSQLIDPETKEKWIVWTKECGQFNPERDYEAQFMDSVKKYLQAYKTQYVLFNARERSWKTIADYFQWIKQGQDLLDEYTRLIQEAVIQNPITIENGQRTVTFAPVSYPIEIASPKSVYTITPQRSIKDPDLSVFSAAYGKAKACRQEKDPKQACTAAFTTPQTTVTILGDFIKVKNPQIKFMFKLNEDLPQEQIDSRPA
ncbi:hypothetical protein HZB00_01045 [Candidatus Woesearchaeota archaeon]|nr:hypothetical protein [Candidatus Woesearchaeota archaeon]